MDPRTKEIRELIHSHLESCDRILTPTICEMKDTAEGKEQLENDILERILKTGNTVGAIINEIEKEYNSNLNND